LQLRIIDKIVKSSSRLVHEVDVGYTGRDCCRETGSKWTD